MTVRIKASVLLLALAICLIAGGFAIINRPTETPKAKEIHKIGVLMNGSFEDRSYTQAQYDGLTGAVRDTGIRLVAQDNVPVDDAFPGRVKNLIASGCEIIVCDNYMYDPYLIDLAAENPGVSFINASGTVTADNLSCCLGRVYQVRYLSGIVAGLQTKTNEIGYVLAYLTPETVRQLNAFTLGVRKANPNAVVYMRHTDDWNDADKAAAVTAALLDAHSIDVLTQHVNPVTPLQVAQERGVWTIGNNFDNRELFADSYLTACVFDWEPFFRARLNDCERNRFIGKNYWGSLRTGMVALSPLTAHCDERAQQAVDEELSRLLDGSFDVFYGPIVDSHGTERVRAGENLSDEQLLYHMDWFVDGVVAE